MTSREILKELEGTETRSVENEGLVFVKEGKFHVNDRVFVPTAKQVKALWDEYFEQEMGPPGQVSRELQEEFGPGSYWWKKNHE